MNLAVCLSKNNNISLIFKIKYLIFTGVVKQRFIFKNGKSLPHTKIVHANEINCGQFQNS